MNKVKYVALNRAEGLVSQCGAVVFIEDGQEIPVTEDKRHFNGAKCVYVQPGTLRSAVIQKMSEWGRTAPDDGGYDKVDFEVGWENGLVYGGRFDMQYGGTDGGETFWTSLKGRVEFYALKRRPSHFNDEQWNSFCERVKEDEGDKYCEKILNECDVN